MPRKGARTRIARGVRRHGAGLQATVKVRGHRAFAQFDLDTPLRVIQQWQEDTRARLRLQAPARPTAGTFAADVAVYLQRADVRAMPTYAERAKHLQEWVARFGGRRRHSITPDDIAQHRDQWLVSRGDHKPPYSASAINNRLRALSNLWTKLDGRRAPNPVAEVAEVEEPDPEARGLDYDVIEAILAAIPDAWVGKRKDGTYTTGKPRPSQTKARLRVIAYTGLSHAQLMRLTPSDVDLAHARLRPPARRKGRKIRRALDKPLSDWLPLIPPAVEAFREFDRLQCWGPFSTGSMWRAFQRACGVLKLDGLRPYDFRHSYLSAIYHETRDLRVTGRFGSHRSERTTARYALGAINAHVAEAAARVRDMLDGRQRQTPDNTKPDDSTR